MNVLTNPSGKVTAIVPDETDIAARLERLPVTAYRRKILASAWFADQIDVALIPFLRARSTGAGVASTVGRGGAILVPIVKSGGPAAAFLVLILGVETRGRVLEAVSL